MRNLYILRHMEPESSGAADDHKRALTEKGMADAQITAQIMREEHIMPALILCSDARRTVQTCAAFRDVWPEAQVMYREDLYLADPGDLYEIIKSADDIATTLMVIGHNPGLHALVNFLAGAGPVTARQEIAVGYPMGTLTIFECPCENWDGLMPAENKLAALYIGGTKRS